MIFHHKCLFYLALSTFDSFLGADAGFFFVLLVGAHCVGNDPPPDKKIKKNGKHDFYKLLILYTGISTSPSAIHNVSNRIISCALLL